MIRRTMEIVQWETLEYRQSMRSSSGTEEEKKKNAGITKLLPGKNVVSFFCRRGRSWESVS